MATEQFGDVVDPLAGADLSSAQHTFVKYDANGDVVQCDTQGEQAVGVLRDDPGSGEPASVGRAGTLKVVAGEAVTAGNLVGTDASGQALDGSLTTGDIFLGVALDDASGAGEVIRVDFRNYLGTHA